MASDSEEDYDDLDFDNGSDAEEDIDEDILDALEGDLAAAAEAEGEGTEAEEETDTESSDGGSDDDDADEEDIHPHKDLERMLTQTLQEAALPSKPSSPVNQPSAATEAVPPPPAPQQENRPPSPAQLRRQKILADIKWPRSFTVEAICAIPHPCATHTLASSLCMTHLITGSDDGYIRDYDTYAAVNGKFGHAVGCSMEFSWIGRHVALHTVRHSPGRLCYVWNAHKGHVSALALQHDEKGFFSAGWDGEAINWDLNTGNMVRKFIAHGAQLAAIAVRPMHANPKQSQWGTIAPGSEFTVPMKGPREDQSNPFGPSGSNSGGVYTIKQDDDAKSDTSYDPLFDEPDADGDGGGPKYNAFGSAPGHPSGAHNLGRGAIAPKGAPPILDPSTYATFSPDLLMTAHVDGQVILWDRRTQTPGKGVGRLWMSEKTPPWCMSACWSGDGSQIYVGRRNGTVEIYDVRQTGRAASGTPKIWKTLRNPASSGVVSCVVAFPDGRHLACASTDNIRLWNVAEAREPDAYGRTKSGVQFKIIPGHHGGFVSQMLVDPAARFLVSASSNRGWHGEYTKTVFVHEIKHLW
ncbi:hypothetical protein BN946_scf184785.g10 [Trametes cinnabarina]|uniref:Transcription factor spt8 beta-propeller domain-containing protein n=1 Tax=Pycnoporus cinnabarinus TaxID=5643 RepID=A0A060S577_PYCCI|nr:hypothetical protein BN946_scf184785.g10 [Trametes cinnabarina]